MARAFLTDRTVLYVGALAGVSGGLAAGLLLMGHGLGNPALTIAMGGIAAVAERGTVRLSNTIYLSISLLPALVAAVLFGPLAAMVVSAASMLGDIRGPTERPYLRWATYTSTRSINGALTGLAALYAGGLTDAPLASVVAATMAGAFAAQVLDAVFAGLTLRVRGTGSALEVIRTLAPVVALSIPLYVPVVAFLSYTYEEVSTWTLPLFFVPALAAQRSFSLYQEQRRLADDLVSSNERLERANVSFATALVAALDARDRYTAGHSAAVAVYSRDIAARMALSADQQRLAHLAGLVHDIGKVGLAPGLLEKTGALTLAERRQMETHSEIGERILAKVDDYAEVATIVRHHHERVDGGGYPDSLIGDKIPLIARIIAVADAYNAMTSDRPYRDAMPSRVARLRLAQAVGTQLDTSVVAAFEAILATATEAYRTGKGPEFRRAIDEIYPTSARSTVAA